MQFDLLRRQNKKDEWFHFYVLRISNEVHWKPNEKVETPLKRFDFKESVQWNKTVEGLTIGAFEKK